MISTIDNQLIGVKSQVVSLKKKAYNTIKDNIITCRYAPGEFLNETQLMEEVGTSRTPVREALSKLEQERFVRIVSKKGIMVSELSLKEIGDVYQARILLEPLIVRRWGSNIPVEKLELCRSRLLTYSPDMDMFQRNELDDSVHRLITDYCPNSYFREWLSNLYCQNERIRIFTGQLGVRMEDNNNDHLKLTEMLLRTNYEETAQFLEAHLETARKNTFDSLLNENGISK